MNSLWHFVNQWHSYSQTTLNDYFHLEEPEKKTPNPGQELPPENPGLSEIPKPSPKKPSVKSIF